jgi:hypothetical protein
MANTALFDALKAAASISPGDTSRIADAVSEKMAPLMKPLQDLLTSVDQSTTETRKIVAPPAEIAAAVSEKMGPLTAQLKDLQTSVDKSIQILQSVAPPALIGDEFVRVRKCLQLLNRLEDWDLADDFDFGGIKELREELESLKGKCLQECGDENVKVKGQIDFLIGELKATFPHQHLRKGDMGARAAYYLQILVARIAILRLAASPTLGSAA